MVASIGDILADKYRVDAVIGQGGCGTIFAARHLVLQQTVALKVLNKEIARSPEAVKRFLREARAAAQMRGEHLARLLDVGTLEGGVPYIAFEYLEGQDLAALLARTGPMPVSEAVGYIIQACEGLAEAHGLGMVHRDLKPANLFLTQGVDGSSLIKVLDFGISKVTHDADAGQGLTQSHAILGSPLYMSPEQISSPATVDTRADIWSLGIILFELLTNKTPFSAPSVIELCIAIAEDRPPSLRTIVPSIPERLSDIVDRCLAKNRQDRFNDVAALAACLTPFGLRTSGAIMQRISAVQARATKRR